MKTIIRSFLINALGLWLVSQITSGLHFTKGYETLLITAAALGLVNLFVRPIINILLLPINIITLGTMRWIVNVAILYLVTYLVPDFTISGFTFSGFSYAGYSVPSFATTGILAFILVSFVLSLISSFLFWVAK